MAGTGDVRGALQRRFTTNTVPTLSPIGQQRRQAAGAGDAQMVSSFNMLEDKAQRVVISHREDSNGLSFVRINKGNPVWIVISQVDMPNRLRSFSGPIVLEA